MTSGPPPAQFDASLYVQFESALLYDLLYQILKKRTHGECNCFLLISLPLAAGLLVVLVVSVVVVVVVVVAVFLAVLSSAKRRSIWISI